MQKRKIYDARQRTGRYFSRGAGFHHRACTAKTCSLRKRWICRCLPTQDGSPRVQGLFTASCSLRLFTRPRPAILRFHDQAPDRRKKRVVGDLVRLSGIPFWAWLVSRMWLPICFRLKDIWVLQSSLCCSSISRRCGGGNVGANCTKRYETRADSRVFENFAGHDRTDFPRPLVRVTGGPRRRSDFDSRQRKNSIV